MVRPVSGRSPSDGAPMRFWHNGSNNLWYALLMLLPSSNTVPAFVTNDGAIEAADLAFVELAENLSTLVEAQRNGG